MNILLEFRSRMDVVIRFSVRFHNGCWSWETDRAVNAGGVPPCRYDDGRWRPLCQCQHNGGGRAGDVGKGGENHCGSRRSQAVEGPHLQRIDKVNEIRRVLVAQIRQEIAELTQLVLVERIQDRIADQMVDEVLEESAEVVKLFPQKRVQQIDEPIVDEPVLQISEEIDKVARLVPHERVQRQADERFVYILVHQIWDEIVGIGRLVPQERVQ